MANFNKVILMGNLTSDPETRYLPSGTPVAEFRLAVNRTFVTASGEKRDETCFIDCSVMGKRAEVVQNYFRKGRPVFVEGRLEYQQWQTPDGQKRSKHRVAVEDFQFIGPAPAGAGRPEGAPPPAGAPVAGPRGPQRREAPGEAARGGYNPADDDLSMGPAAGAEEVPF